MRRTADTVIARRNAKDAARTEEVALRREALLILAPNANPEDLRFLAIHCGTNPTFATILRVLEAR